MLSLLKRQNQVCLERHFIYLSLKLTLNIYALYLFRFLMLAIGESDIFDFLNRL